MSCVLVLSALLCLFSTTVAAQDTLRTPDEPVEWGEVSKEALRVDDYAPDSNASAVIISDFGDGYFKQTGQIEIDYHTRIKILRESGYDAARVTIPYYADEGLQDVDAAEGVTYTLAEGEVKEHELDDDDVFTEEINEEYKRVRFTLPNLERGAIVEYRYELELDNPLYIPEWEFQHEHPTLYSEYGFRIPSFLKFVALATGNYDYVSVTTDTKQSMRVGRELEKSWVGTDLPALREEPYMTTPDDYRTRLRFQAQELRNPRTGKVLQRFMTSWPDLAETQMESDSFGDELGENTGGLLGGEEVIMKKVKSLTEGLSSDSAKVDAIYDYVQSAIEWNGQLRIRRKKDFDEIFESNAGNSAEVNLLLVSMLQMAGVDAHPVMLSTREHGKPIPLYPILDQFNHVIAAATWGERNRPFLMDATEPLCPPSMLPERDLNRQGWLVRTGSPEWVDLDPPEKSGRQIFVKGTLKADGTLEAEVNVRDRGYSALGTRRSLQETDASKHLREDLLGHLNAVSLSDVTVENRDTLHSPLRANATVTVPGYGQATGDMLYFRPRIVPSIDENPFKRKTRSFPVDFAHPETTSYTLVLQLPDGYRVKDTPPNRRIRMPNNEGAFRRLVQASGGRIVVRSTMQRQSTRVPPARYKALRELYIQVVSTQSEQVVLEKVDTEASTRQATGRN